MSFLKTIFILFMALLAPCGCTWFSLVASSGGQLLFAVLGFSLRWFLLLLSTGSRHEGFSGCSTWALEHRLNSCSTQAQLLCGMWDLPALGMEPVSLALADEFFTTESPGKP